MPDVFISYSVHDKVVAEAFYQRLTSAGLAVFLDCRSLEPGTNWSDALKENLTNSCAFLFLATHRSLSSPNPNQEFGMAMQCGSQIIPVVWDMTPKDLPPWVGAYQAIVLTGKTAKEQQQEVDRVIGNLCVQKKSRKMAVVLGIIALAVLVVFVGKALRRR